MSRSERKPVAVLVLSLLWLGLLLGVSFLATPVKFLAPSLSLPVALDVGRQTFAAFNPLELLLAVALLGAYWWEGLDSRHQRVSWALAGLPLLLVLAQTLWLLPVLDARVEIILRGGEPAPSQLHNLYIVVDLLKVLLLGVVAWRALRVPG